MANCQPVFALRTIDGQYNGGSAGPGGWHLHAAGHRFRTLAYTPLTPALVDAGWFSIHTADYLGAINLLGYLVGASLAHRATERFGVRAVLAFNLALTVASFYACALDWGVLWYGAWPAA